MKIESGDAEEKSRQTTRERRGRHETARDAYHCHEEHLPDNHPADAGRQCQHDNSREERRLSEAPSGVSEIVPEGVHGRPDLPVGESLHLIRARKKRSKLRCALRVAPAAQDVGELREIRGYQDGVVLR